MNKTFFSFGIVFILCVNIFNKAGCKAAKEKDCIIWEEGKKLKWDDFQSNDFKGLGVSATSAVQIKLYYEVENSIKWFSVECLFFKKESTARYDKTDYVLNHEQGHFDIGEIFARRLRKEILKIRSTINRKNYLNLDSVYHAYTQMLVEGQELYDKETSHSNDTLQQRVWDIRIQKSLDSLKNYSNQKY